MKVKIFSQRQSLWTGALSTQPLEDEVNRWLGHHPAIKIVRVRHDVSGCFWSFTQFIITVYYTD